LTAASAALGAEVPRQSAEYAFTLPNGQQELLSKYKGKVVVLEFLFTTCPHCQKTAQVLSKLNAEFGPNFQPLGVAINPNPEIPKFVQQYGVNYPIGTGTKESAYAYLQHSLMTPFYVPQLVIIDKGGVIRGQYGGTDPFFMNEEANVRNLVKELLAEPASGKSGKTSRKKAG
jgi:thiol-disulfide isomerase/thioredoxin